MNRIKKGWAAAKSGFFVWKNKVLTAACMAMTALLLASPVAAGSLEGTKLVTGTKELLNDATSILLILAPIIGICVSAYFLIRRGAADEMDQKKWENRLKVALISMIGVVVLSATVKAILNYFN